ncbi:MAG: hypothetical protein M3273_07960 [Actinomycetota bacterium]|nr:hypothetical protein [Actinomycetota bacterium]
MDDRDAQTTPGAAGGPQWVSAADAADIAGITPGAVRYWARHGLIVSQAVPSPRGEQILVRLDEVVRQAKREHEGAVTPDVAAPEAVTELPAQTSELAPILKSIPELMSQLTAAVDRAARAETKVEFLSAQVAELKQRLRETESRVATVAPGAVSPAASPEPVPAAAPGAGSAAEDRTAEDLSLDDLFAGPSAGEPAPEAERVPDVDRSREHPAEVERDGVEWHEPVWPEDDATEEATRPEPEPATSPPVPKAPPPTNIDLYGSGRRRWWRRRR